MGSPVRKAINDVVFVALGVAALVFVVGSVVLTARGRWGFAFVGYAAGWFFYNAMRAKVGLKPWRIGTGEEDRA